MIARPVGPCEVIPTGYRIAYRDYPRYVAVCYPLGLHLIVRGFRRIWEWSLAYQPSEYELDMAAAYEAGLQRGRDEMALTASEFVRMRLDELYGSEYGPRINHAIHADLFD